MSSPAKGKQPPASFFFKKGDKKEEKEKSKKKKGDGEEDEDAGTDVDEPTASALFEAFPIFSPFFDLRQTEMLHTIGVIREDPSGKPDPWKKGEK